MFVSGVVNHDCIDDLARWDLTIRGVEETDEVLMRLPSVAPADHGSVEDVEGGEKSGRPVALTAVGHGVAPAQLNGEVKLGLVQGLDLTFFVDREVHRMSGRTYV
jgi:hypothetical protein